MAVSISITILIVSLHLLAIVLSIHDEHCHSTAKVFQDQPYGYYYCLCTSSVSTTYGLLAAGLLLISQTVVNVVTKCLCLDKGVVKGGRRTVSNIFFIISWVGFLGVEACLLGGSVKNAYHPKYFSIFGKDTMSCGNLDKAVFAAGAAYVFLSMAGSVVYYWVHSIIDTGVDRKSYMTKDYL